VADNVGYRLWPLKDVVREVEQRSVTRALAARWFVAAWWTTILRAQSTFQFRLRQDQSMKAMLRAFSIIHGLIAILFACAALMLILIAAKVGLLAAAAVALQIAQSIVEEEVLRDAHISGPTRVRRFLSRFLVVAVVALTIEGLVATFKAAHEDPANVLDAASLVLSAGVLLAGWGVLIRMNRYAEELEPEAKAEAKREDKKLK
jgi:hypothetical protein